MAALPTVKSGTEITKPRHVDLATRPAIAASLGPTVKGASLVHVDPKCPETGVAGVIQRFARRPPPINRSLKRRFARFVANWLKKNLTPLQADIDLSFETWLANTNYPEWRKEELRDLWKKSVDLLRCDPGLLKTVLKKYTKCKSFAKDEFYPTWKQMRGINSRHDLFKIAAGPIFKAIEEVLYKNPYFIKHVPVAERPQYILDRLYRDGAKYVATDYTSFEALFTGELMQICEFQLYRHMTQFIPEGQLFDSIVIRVLGGLNECKFKDFAVKLRATRMSGEMCTSLGNGFSNLMFMLFMCERGGCRDVVGVVEGDDGLFTMVGTPPTTEDFAQLGLIIKMEIHDQIETASFCGMVFDREDRLIVRDPRRVLATFGWTSGQYSHSKTSTRMKLLRAKSLSLAYQYPGCPIVWALASYGLRVTTSIVDTPGWRQWVIDRQSGSYMRDHYKEVLRNDAPIRVPPTNTRLLVENLYGIPVSTQLAIEEYLLSKTDISQLDFPLIDELMDPVWKQYYGGYSHLLQPGETNMVSFSAPVIKEREWSYSQGVVVFPAGA